MPESTRPYWPAMRPWDFDASITPELGIPTDTTPLSDGADLLALIGVKS